MKYERYTSISVSNDFSIFDFVSHGTKGSIHKRIMFTPTEEVNFYNLAFGDVDEQGELNDYAISDNGDRNKVLATVAAVIAQYLTRFPHREIYFEGSTPERTRLYRMAVSVHLEELLQQFDIYVKTNEGVAPFTKNMAISTFIVTRKRRRKK